MTPPVALALSPHLDDAAFSCGGTLAALAALGWRVVVATVFTASVPNPTGFALACQLDKNLPPEIDYMKLRRGEDEAACRALGAEPRWLPFTEAPHRGYPSAKALFEPPRPEDGIARDLAPALTGLLADMSPDLVLAPQAIGGHVDHVQLLRAIDLAQTDLPILWWRDFPYAARHADREPYRARFAGLPGRSVSLDAEQVAAKNRGARAYLSQLGFQFGGAEGWERMAAEAGPVERFRLSGSLPDAAASLVVRDGVDGEAR